MKIKFIAAVLMIAIACMMSAACSSGGGGNSGTSVSHGSTVTRSSVLQPGSECANGGITVESGVDENGNGVLDSTEVDVTQKVCNGTDGAAVLINITDEPAGGNCAAGGVKIESGVDANGNGVLEDSEITPANTRYICSGATGTTGSDGTDGATTLIRITDEAAGANCSAGGKKIESGLDADDDGVLDDSEVNVNATAYICNGTDGTDTSVFHTIGGSVSGLSGTIVLQKNGYEDIALTADGAFTFPTPLVNGAGYSVVVKTHPSGQICSTNNGSGAISGSNITNVAVNCYNFGPRYSAAPGWNDYVKASDTSQACNGTETGGYSACIHGGEMRALVVPGRSACAGLTASDALGAFDWTCTVDAGTVKMVSTGLKDGKYLSDLIDFNAASIKANSITVQDGAATYLTTGSSAWWTNPVVADNDGLSAGQTASGVIYIVSAEAPQATYTIDRSKVALVIKPGVTLQGAAATGETVIKAANSSFLWLEGSVNAAGDDIGVKLDTVTFSVLRNIKAESASNGAYMIGVFLNASSNNMLADIAAGNNSPYGLYLTSSSYNTLKNIAALNNGWGVILESSSDNALSNVSAVNNREYGIVGMSSNNNVLSDIAAINNAYGIMLSACANNAFTNISAANSLVGVYLSSSANNNTFSSVSAVQNNTGVVILASSNNIFSGVSAANNNTGVSVSNSSNNIFSEIAAANNWQGVSLSSSSNNKFTGLLKAGNSSADCFVFSGTNPGLVNGTCANNGSSDATLVTGVTLSASFAGKVTTDDAVNQSDTNGAATYPAEPSTFDWTSFENAYRGWGKDGAFGDISSWGRFGCSTATYSNQTDCETNGGTWNGAGRIWDWSLKSTDTVIKSVLSLPTGSQTLTHTWSGSNTTTFLRNAIEISSDGIGNDNLLCESGETCLYTPNIGAYQGHGSLIDAGTIGTGGTIQNVTLKKYEANGY